MATAATLPTLHDPAETMTTRFIANRADIDPETLAKFERSWGHTGGDAQAAILDGESKRIISWHKTRRAAQAAFSRHANTFAVR